MKTFIELVDYILFDNLQQFSKTRNGQHTNYTL